MNKVYPEFSVLISVYAKENPVWLKQAIESVLANSILPKQIVIVKDGKLTNELDSVLDYYSNIPIFQIVGYEVNKGLGFALNYGLEYCSCDYVARMDSDDVCANNRFEKQLDLFLEKNELALIGSNIYEFVGDPSNVQSIRVAPCSHSDIIKFSKKRNPFNHPSVMFLKKAIIDSGGYIDMFRCEDYYLWYRVLKKNYQTENIQDCLVYMRISDDFFKRRGGIKAFKQRTLLSRIMLNDKYISTWTHFYVFIVSLLNCFIPSFLRKFLYYSLLRKKAK